MILFDSHTHLFSEKFIGEENEMIQRSFNNGVKYMVMPNVDLSSINKMYDIETAFPENCFATMGLHPCSVDNNYLITLKKMEAELEKRNFAAIGETGLDYYWDLTYKQQQQLSLVKHIEWAKKYKLPIILHTRDSLQDTLELIEKHNDESLTGVFHCFGGDAQDIERIKQLQGFYIGIGGVVTFKKSTLPETLVNTPLDIIVLETDAPYLAPTPYRGKKNESSYLPLIAQKIAEIKNISIEKVAEITTKNSKKLFSSKFINILK